MAKNLVATETSLELYLNDVLQKTFPRGEIKTEITSTALRVKLLQTGDNFSLSLNDLVDGESFESKQEMAKTIGSLSIGPGTPKNDTDKEPFSVEDIIVDDATDEESAILLANACKDKINEILSVLRTEV